MTTTKNNKPTFNHILFNNLVASIANSLIWVALTFWVILQTNSVLAVSVVAGVYALANLFTGVFFGSIVDHNLKQKVMIGSSLVSLVFYILAAGLFFGFNLASITSIDHPVLWVFIILLMFGVVTGNLRSIGISTLVSILFEESQHGKINGQIGTMMGISFAVTSFLSGIVMGYLGFDWALGIAIFLTILTILHLLIIKIPETLKISENSEKTSVFNLNNFWQDIKKTIAVITGINSLFALIFFTTLNNFIGGVFMALMDAYGLSLVSVEIWGLLLGILSFSFILGGILIAKYGVGKPLKTIFLVNTITWTTCIIFPIQPSIILLVFGFFVWMLLTPFVEASEQTILQKVVPQERQGRVFGFAQSIESMATPITTFFIGPITQSFFIPFMTTGTGVDLIGSWFGVGSGRGMALVFILAGIFGLISTITFWLSKHYKILTREYEDSVPDKMS